MEKSINSTRQLVCIHGMWGTPAVWDSFKQKMQAQGYEVHTPALPCHASKEEQISMGIGQLSVRDYIASMVEFVSGFEEPPIVVGHSMGGVIAQCVAAQVPVSQLILLNPAAPAGVIAFRPSVLRLFARHLLKWGFWNKPIQLSKEEANWGLFNHLAPELASKIYAEQVFESGRAVAEIAFWFFDKHRSVRVDFKKVQCPVLVIGAKHDRITPASVCRVVAKRYAKSSYHELHDIGHWTIEGEPLDKVIELSINALNAKPA